MLGLLSKQDLRLGDLHEVKESGNEEKVVESLAFSFQ